ncbi:UDP-2,3-diacylglucosamine diphosphatase [Acidithiobacillus thiooxidans]|nr:UDP-2,3-diacylglucosamine diphosphatase [Acidithiobacillus thiooxidans]MDR7927681.1 UDP-2,3-diacylglucosamine diphosphatase [Acidithiobacillus thiooxidans]MDX5935936.1 UDP-2,3-diacylglucosamine diphosphatase [Acidithiobacillus thiooxidans]
MIRASVSLRPDMPYLDVDFEEGPIWFISDLHLSPQQPALTRFFQQFCETRAKEGRAVFILGDLFDYWVHPDQSRESAYAEVFAHLQQLVAAGIRVYVMVGNRDFALSKTLLTSFGLIPIPDPMALRLGTQNILLTHGDLLCTDDRRYQIFRRVIRHPLIRLSVGNLPYSCLQKLATGLRRGSTRAVQKKSLNITDAHPLAIQTALHHGIADQHLEQGFDVLVHGHTHRPVWEHTDDGWRMVLGAWSPDAACIGRWAAGQWSLEKIMLTP